MKKYVEDSTFYYKIGNIVTKKHLKIRNERFNIVNDIDNIIKTIPTIIVDYKLVNLIYPNNEVNIFNKQIDKDIYWTIDEIDDRTEFENDINKFIQYCYSQLIKNIRYFFIDNIHIPEEKLSNIYNKIKYTSPIYGYNHDNKIIYLYLDNTILSFDLEFYSFTGIKIEKFIKKINKLTTKMASSDSLLSQYLEDVKCVSNKIKYIPYFLYIDNSPLDCPND
jgi:hypothetical protein